MKIYTRTGDKGTTALFGGDRVKKHHLRITAYGTVDETNSQIGLARAFLNNYSGFEIFDNVLGQIQSDLFTLGADLATPLDAKARVPRISAGHVDQLEKNIDRLDQELPPLKQFILPGGTLVAAQLHVARTVCRRAERLVSEAAETETLNEQVLVFLNRLSDLLFVAARWFNFKTGTDDITWKPAPAES